LKRFLFNFSEGHEEILSLLLESGAKVSEAGWMTILDDQFFGTPLVLAHWLHNMSNGLPIAEKILNIVWKEHQVQLSKSDATG
jgi:hypothetical protein